MENAKEPRGRPFKKETRDGRPVQRTKQPPWRNGLTGEQGEETPPQGRRDGNGRQRCNDEVPA